VLIENDVPKGAVVSPTLFWIFINDIPVNYSKNKFYSLLFADDLCTFKIYKKSGKIINNCLQTYLNNRRVAEEMVIDDGTAEI
jgi:hypothetical protein